MVMKEETLTMHANYQAFQVHANSWLSKFTLFRKLVGCYNQRTFHFSKTVWDNQLNCSTFIYLSN